MRLERDVRRAFGDGTDGQAGEFVSEAMVHVAVVRFVRPHDQNDIAQGRIDRQSPIIARDFRRRQEA